MTKLKTKTPTTLEEISKYLNVNVMTVFTWINDGNLSKKPTLAELDKIKDDMKKAEDLIEKNYSLNRAAKEAGIKRNTIQSRVDAGIIVPKYNLLELFPNLIKSKNGIRKRLIKLNIGSNGESDGKRGATTPKWLLSPEQFEFIKESTK